MRSIKPETKQGHMIKATADLASGRFKPFRPVHNIYAISALILLDLLAVAISLAISYFIRYGLLVVIFPSLFSEKILAQAFDLLWFYPLVFIFCLAYENLYHKRLPFWIEVEGVLKAGTLTLFISVVLLYIVQIGHEISGSIILLTWAFSMLTIPAMRYYGKNLLCKINIWNRPILLIGNYYTLPKIYEALKSEKTMGYTVMGYISDSNVDLEWATYETASSKIEPPLPFLGSLAEAESIIDKTGVEDIIIAEPTLSSAKLVELSNKLQRLVKNVILVPDLFGITLNGIEVAYFFEEQAVLLHIRNRLKSKFNRLIKRIFDLIVGTVLSLSSLPVLLVISLAIKVDSPGPIFHISNRIGQGGRLFYCYKFRTMHLNADKILKEFIKANDQASFEWGYYNKLITEDPRVTRLGRILRRLSLDELPQLLNVMKGEMSLVGPRPYLVSEEGQMGNWAVDILIVKPGLTGLWQVSGRNRLSFEKRLMLDSWYMKNWSIWLDTVILLKTLRVIMKSDGAY